jgi:multicomponent Na+:H+ antiporter subunit D
VRLALPIFIPLLAAALGLLSWRKRMLQRVLGVVASFLLLAAGLDLLRVVSAEGVQVLHVAGWPAPFGIVLVADLFSAIMVVLAGSLAAVVSVYSTADLDARHEIFGFHPLYHVLLMGVCGTFLTGDIFNLYVWFEVMLIASFVLLALGGTRGQIEGALKYVTLNLLASSLFLTAVGLLYSAFGTLNMAALAERLRAEETPAGVPTVLAMLFLVAFGTKAAMFPLFFWLPASYHTPPVAISTIFAGLLTKVGVYSLIRVFTLLFVGDAAFTHGLILFLAGATMLTGVLGAMAQNEFRRILAFHSVSQVGYMLMGLGLFTPAAIAGSILFMLHHSVVKSNLFLVSGIARRLGGSFELKRLGGLYAMYPHLALLFLLPAFSLAGFPPFSGFFAKLVLVKAGIQAEAYTIVAVSLAVSVFTLVSMMKIWGEAFWRPSPEGSAGQVRVSSVLWIPVIVLTFLTVAIGVGAESIYSLAHEAARQLIDPSLYMRAVLGDKP